MAVATGLLLSALMAVADCGVVPKIEGPGRMEAEPGEFPYLALILKKENNEVVTSGVLIKPTVVLSLAYNYDILGNKAEDVYVVLGAYNRSLDEPTRQEINVSKIMTHPLFSASFPDTIRADVSLIKLAEPVVKSSRVKVFPVRRINSDPKLDNQLKSAKCVSCGWGRIKWTEYEIVLPRTLQKYEPVMQNAKNCQNFVDALPLPWWSKKNWMCSLNPDLTSTRPADGGNPLLCSVDEGPLTLFGLTSGGILDTELFGWSFYSRISTFRDWIVTNAKQLQNE